MYIYCLSTSQATLADFSVSAFRFSFPAGDYIVLLVVAALAVGIGSRGR